MAKMTKRQILRANAVAKREDAKPLPKCHVMMTRKRQCSNDAGPAWVCKVCYRPTCEDHMDSDHVCIECRASKELPKAIKLVMLTFTTHGNPVPIVISMQLQPSQNVDMNFLRLLFQIEQSLNAIQSDVRTHIDLIEEEA